MKNVFKLTNKYIILATVLILYSLITNVYTTIFTTGRVAPAALFLAMLIVIFITSAFLAGWFKMVKTAIIEPDMKDENSLIKVFPEGVGEYVLPVLSGIVILVTFTLLGCAVVFYLGHHFIGNPNIDLKELLESSKSTAAMKTYLASLPGAQVAMIMKWNNLISTATLCLYFLLFLYYPVMFFKTKNPLMALFIAIKDLFGKKFLKTLGIFLLIFFGNMLISVLTILTASNALMSFIFTLLGFYVLTASAVGLFSYYYNSFTQSHLGQNIDIKI